ncbi:hypothetical protein PO909_010920 [Leuciscus waleckii]
MLVNNGSAFTVCPAENITSPTLDLEPRQQSLCCTNMTPEPTADRELEPAVMHEPAPVKRTEPTIALETEPHSESDQVHKLATSCATAGVLVEFEDMEEDPAQTPTTEGTDQYRAVNRLRGEEKNSINSLEETKDAFEGASESGQASSCRGEAIGLHMRPSKDADYELGRTCVHKFLLRHN